MNKNNWVPQLGTSDNSEEYSKKEDKKVSKKKGGEGKKARCLYKFSMMLTH